MQTPEFLLWSLEFSCPVRGFEGGRDPERIERQLRAARAVSDAHREGRLFEGLCLDPPLGFRVGEALALYGGLAAVEAACGTCPANVCNSAGALADCYGEVPLWGDEAAVHELAERAIDSAGLADTVAGLFPVTNPRWHGLWMHSPQTGKQLDALLALLAAMRLADAALSAAFRQLHAGIQTAKESNLPLHVRLYPRGRVEGTWWRLVLHCPRCRAAWPVERWRRCGVCGYAGHPSDDKKRRARGRRPYLPLERLLGKEQAAALLERYAESNSIKTPAP